MQWLLPPILFLLIALAMTAITWGFPVGPILPVPSNYLLGAALLLSGLGVTLGAARGFKRADTNIHTFRAPDRLVTDGLFRYSRNPMYLGFTVALLGLALISNALLNLVLVAAYLLVADRWYIPFEERMAEKAFGDAYRTYRRTTRRWL